jgi:hypothetical protein
MPQFIDQDHANFSLQVFLEMVKRLIDNRADFTDMTEDKRSILVKHWFAAIEVARIPFIKHKEEKREEDSCSSSQKESEPTSTSS